MIGDLIAGLLVWIVKDLIHGLIIGGLKVIYRVIRFPFVYFSEKDEDTVVEDADREGRPDAATEAGGEERPDAATEADREERPDAPADSD